jgi:hypothetical protein
MKLREKLQLCHLLKKGRKQTIPMPAGMAPGHARTTLMFLFAAYRDTGLAFLLKGVIGNGMTRRLEIWAV